MTILTTVETQATIPAATNFRGVIDFGDPQVSHFKQQMNALKQSTRAINHVVAITQFGDSHSAADFFTGELRTLLQYKYGDAGIGWVTPMYVQGQHHMAVTWKSKNWQLFTSRNTSDRDYPMGGYIAEPTKNGGYIQVIPNTVEDIWLAKLAVKPLKNATALTVLDVDKNKQQFTFKPKSKVGHWQTIPVKIKAPFTIMADKGEVELGGIWLQKYQHSGVIVSMLGTNGARQSIWQKWSPAWFQELATTKSDMVILEYGTNESFDAMLDLTEYRRNLVENIQKIRATLPKATVLIISSPDTMLANTQSHNLAERQPPNFHQIRRIQQDVAKQEKTLYWDWQTAMGGDCIIEKWLLLDLARPDLIHLTKQGYAESAKLFYSDLIEFIARQ